MMYDNVLQGLVKFNEKGEIVPALAERWQGSPSSLTWTFYLRNWTYAVLKSPDKMGLR
jgi:peptide/nickel transport system substrate-binding protein